MRRLRPGRAEGWVSIQNPPIGVTSLCAQYRTPPLCFVEAVLYVAGVDDFDFTSDAMQAYDFSNVTWTVCAPLPEPRCCPVCVLLAGCLYVTAAAGIISVYPT